MVGFVKTRDSRYYVCNSVPNRRGLGCGAGVYVPQAEVEQEVIHGLNGLLGVCTDQRGFVRQVNAELRRIWEESNGHDPNAATKLAEIDVKIGNIRAAIEDGLADTTWANERIHGLVSQRDRLADALVLQGEAPQIDAETAMAYRRDAAKVLAHGDTAERKQFLRLWVDEIKLAPETLEVEVHYKIPEPVVDSMGAGALSVSMHQWSWPRGW
jgi:hypothetical protein